MKPYLLATLVLAVALSGCLSDSSETTPPSDPAQGAAPWALDCTLGNASQAPWEEPCAVRTTFTPYSKIEAWIAVDPTDPANVIIGAKDMDPALSNDCVWTSYGVTHDAGQTWTPLVLGGTFDERGPTDPAFGYACNTDPLMEYGPDGTLYAVLDLYAAGASPNSAVAATAKMQLYASDDAGDTWPRTTTLILGDSVASAPDYPRIAISPTTGTVFASFIDFLAGERCYITASDDQGASAREPVIIPVQGSRGCQVIAAGPDGTLVTGGLQGETTAAQATWFARSTDDGRSWTEPAPGPELDGITGFEENDFPAFTNLELAYDKSGGPHHGRLYLSATQAPGDTGAGGGDEGDDDADVTLYWSDDHGETWDGPVRVNQDTGDHDQWIANVAVADDGSVHLVFFDKRHDPDNRLLDVTHAVSLDGGQTWTETRVTRHSFDGDLGRHQNSNELTGPVPSIGDYLGIDTTGEVVWLGFPTSHLGGPPVMAAAKLVSVGVR